MARLDTWTKEIVRNIGAFNIVMRSSTMPDHLKYELGFIIFVEVIEFITSPNQQDHCQNQQDAHL